jgi:hypothetical protein
MLRRRTALLLVLAVLLSLLVAPAARACSCFLGDPRDALQRADGAFIGTLTDVRPVASDPAYADYTFEVETAVKGDLGATIELRAGSTDASCAFEAQVGDRIGAFLAQQDGRWWSGLCSQIDPDLLLRAAAPLPEPDGRGPTRFVMGINIGPNRLMALDARGKTLAYGRGDGSAIDVDLCPGSRRVVEAARVDRSGIVVVRELPSLRVVRRIEVVSGPRSPRVSAVCLNGSGSRVLAVERHGGEHWVHEITGAADRIAWHGPARSVTIDGDRVLVLDGRALSQVDVATGALAPLATVPARASSLTVSPAGSWVAGLTSDGDGASSIFVVARGGGAADRFDLDTLFAFGSLIWLDDRRFTYLPSDGSRAYVIQASTTEPVSGFDGWFADASTLSGRTAFGTSWGYLISARLGDGEVRVIRIFDSPETGALDVVPRSVG